MPRVLDAIAKMDAHHRLLIGFIVAAVVALVLRTHALWTASLATVVLSWLLMHAVFGLRYAHRFYDDSATSAQKHAGGLKFPEDELPDYRDFAYFSFVIGMTCQVSDVNVTSREMRRLVLLHGIFSFGFNTVIFALTINTVSSFL